MKQDMILSAVDISVIRGEKEILNVPSISVKRGEFVAVTGPNGSGKSTLLKTLGFLESPSRGSISLGDKLIRGSKEQLSARRKMAMVFQDPLLLRGTVMDNINIGLKLRGFSKTERAKRAEFWLQRFRITNFRNRDVRTLSGGEAQRVSLARAFALEPEVLFLDEPFTYLDAPTKGSLVSELKEIIGETETTTLMVTHDFSDIPYLADRMLVLIGGKIKESGPANDVMYRPATREAAEFLGVENIWAGKVFHRNGEFYLALDGVEINLQLNNVTRIRQLAEDKSKVFACIRPDQVEFRDLGTAGLQGRSDDVNQLKGRIDAIQPFGYYYKIRVRIENSAGNRTEGPPKLSLTAMVPTVRFDNDFRVGKSISLVLPSEKIHLIKFEQ